MDHAHWHIPSGVACHLNGVDDQVRVRLVVLVLRPGVRGAVPAALLRCLPEGHEHVRLDGGLLVRHLAALAWRRADVLHTGVLEVSLLRLRESSAALSVPHDQHAAQLFPQHICLISDQVLVHQQLREQTIRHLQVLQQLAHRDRRAQGQHHGGRVLQAQRQLHHQVRRTRRKERQQ